MLLGLDRNGSMTMVGNLLAHNVERNPLSRARELVFVNNLVYDRGTMDVDCQSEDGRVTKSSIVGNVFLRGPSFSRATKPIYVRTTGTYSLVSGSRVYSYDNYAPESGSSYSALMTLHGRRHDLGLMTQTYRPGVEHRSRRAQDREQRGVRPRAHVRGCSSHGPRQRGQAHRVDVKNAQRPDHQLRVAQRHHALQQECRRLAVHTRRTRARSRCRRIRHRSRRMATRNLENWLHSMDRPLVAGCSTSSPASPPALSVQ